MAWTRLGLLLLLITGCATREPPTNRVAVDVSPVGCGYRWFQSGYSPYLEIDCTADRDHLREAQILEATDHAWAVARERCPAACPPQRLEDTVEWQHPAPEGVCRDGVAYYFTRVFFHCAHTQSKNVSIP